jgi:hypothetical protein
MQDVTHKDACRLCGSKRLDLVLPLLPSAIGDAFVGPDQRDEPQGVYPLATYLCLDCGHLQNLDVINPEILFRNYTYRTSVSLGLVEHFRQYAATVVERIGLREGALDVEIGSNDGSLLKAFKSHGLRVVGVDPARNIAAAATAEGIPTIPEFFTSALAKQIREDHGPASLMCANNVFAHADGLDDIVAGIRSLLTDDGVFVFEVSYILAMIDALVFDTIYHEHVSHHALIPLETFLNRFDLTMFDVERAATKGGSIRGFVQVLSSGTRVRTGRLAAMLQEEERRGITRPEIYRDFFAAIEARKRQTLVSLDQAIARGKRIAAYGASTTTTTLMYHFELGSRVDFIVDDNPLKQGTFSPGLHIPVFNSSELYVRRPHIVVVLAWIYAEPIIKRNQRYIDEGGRFLVPLPDFRIVPPETQ